MTLTANPIDVMRAEPTMPTDLHLDILKSVRIATPCPTRWEEMTGDDRLRHCARCDLDVHNISAMSSQEAAAVLSRALEGRVCARLYRRADGTILTRDCPVGIARARRRVLLATSRIAAAIGLASLAATAAHAAESKTWGNFGWAMRLAYVKPVDWLVEKVRGSGQSWNAHVAGDVAIPRVDLTEAEAHRLYLGPHPWEYRR